MVGSRTRSIAAGRAAFALAAAGLLLAACSGTSSSGSAASSAPPSSAPPSSAPPSSAPASSAPASSAPASSAPASPSSAAAVSTGSTAASSSTAGGAAAVATTNGALGVYLVDGQGRTLYMFDADTEEGKSACYGGCATAWPPLTTTGAPTASGSAAGGKLKTITRTDGSKQVVYGEYPLYYFDKDTAAGQTDGQAVGGTWWVVGSDGEPIKTAAGSGSAPASTG